MKKLAYAFVAMSTLALAACNNTTTTIVRSLSDEPPADDAQARGFVIQPTDVTDFTEGTVSQVGGLFYVHGGATLSSTQPVNIDVACGVVGGYGTFPIEKKHPLAQDISTTIGGSIGVPTLFKYVLGGIKVDLSAQQQVDIKVQNLTYETLSIGDLATLSGILAKSSKCQGILATLPRSIRPSVFQLVGIAYADISGTVKRTGKVAASAAGASITPIDDSKTVAINSKTVAFKVFKAVN